MINPIRIIITEDKQRWRKVIREELRPFNIEVIAEAENGKVLLELLKTIKPDVVLLDLAMPVLDGNQTLKQVDIDFPDTKIIVMSLYDDPSLMEDYLLRGAKGCLSKTDAASNMTELADAIQKVANGGKYFNYDRRQALNGYTIRRKEIINQIAQGKTTDSIAAELGITRDAVDKQKKKIMKVMGAKNPAEMLKHIFETGLQYFRGPGKPRKKKP